MSGSGCEPPRGVKAQALLPSVFACGVAALCGCAAAPSRLPSPATPRPLTIDAGIVLIAHGIVPDGGWPRELLRGLESRGVVAAIVEHDCWLPGYLLGSGTDGPAARAAAFVERVEAAHRESGCGAPLAWHGVGYSAGTVILLKATWRGVRLESARLGGSPIFAASPVLAEAVDAGRVGRVVNHPSPFDGLVGWGYGMGQWGTWIDAEDPSRIENAPTFELHGFPPFDEAYGEALALSLLASERDRRLARRGAAIAHSCFAPGAFRERFFALRTRLEAGEDGDP